MRNLRIEARQRGVLAGDFLRQEELHDDEDGQQEDDAEDERRQRIDETGPVIDATVAAGAGKRHGVFLQILTAQLFFRA